MVNCSFLGFPNIYRKFTESLIADSIQLTLKFYGQKKKKEMKWLPKNFPNLSSQKLPCLDTPIHHQFKDISPSNHGSPLHPLRMIMDAYTVTTLLPPGCSSTTAMLFFYLLIDLSSRL